MTINILVIYIQFYCFNCQIKEKYNEFFLSVFNDYDYEYDDGTLSVCVGTEDLQEENK